MIHRIHNHTSNILNRASAAGALSIAASVLVGAGSLLACGGASTGAAQPKTAAMQAAAIARTECGAAYRDDAQVAEILNGGLVEGAGPLYKGIESNRSNQHLEGAAIRVRPMKGVSAEWLARALTCHGAEQALGQRPAPSSASDPFFLPDALPTINVRSAGDAFEVEVTATTLEDATEILARARALASIPGIASASAAEHPMAVDLSR